MPDPRERYYDDQEAVRAALDGLQARLWTAGPGIIQSFDPATVTASVQPAIKGRQQGKDGSYTPVNLPLLPDVPVLFVGGGGFTLTFPVTAGDECLLVFASRCIDAWWAHGGIQSPPRWTMHDINDGIAIVGLRSQARLLHGISGNSTQLRSDDGATVIDVSSGTIALTASMIKLNGPVMATSSIVATGNVTANGIDMDTHRHTGVAVGTGQTGGPVG